MDFASVGSFPCGKKQPCVGNVPEPGSGPRNNRPDTTPGPCRPSCEAVYSEGRRRHKKERKTTRILSLWLVLNEGLERSVGSSIFIVGSINQSINRGIIDRVEM